MNKKISLLTLILEGEPVRFGRIPVSQLTDKIGRVRIHDIEPLEDLTEAIEEFPIATTQAYDFWTSKTLEELAQTQGVKPIDDITALYGTWPGDVDDGFEEFVQELRQGNLIGKDSL